MLALGAVMKYEEEVDWLARVERLITRTYERIKDMPDGKEWESFRMLQRERDSIKKHIEEDYGS